MKLLDTSVIIGLLRGEERIEKLVETEGETLCTCFPVQCELYRGTRLARRTEEGEEEVEALLDQLESLETGNESARKVAELKEEYPGISSFDLMIAGTCLAHDCSIVTKDSDFRNIQELETEIVDMD